jgi:hypothetical protein
MNRFERRDNSTKVVVIIVGSVCGLLMLLVLACGGLTYLWIQKVGQVMGPQLQAQQELMMVDGVVQSFLNDLSAGQIDSAYNRTTAAYRARQTLPQFKAFVNQNPLLTKFVDAQQAPLNNQPGANRLSLQYTLTGNGILNLTFQVIKEGADWKIDGVTIP